MGFFSAIGGFFSRTAKAVEGNPVTQEVAALALRYVKNAAVSGLSDAAKREGVVKALVARGVPESIARIAVELAVQSLKAQIPSA